MSRKETHFELFLRKSPKASWVLTDALPDRTSAIEKAKTILLSYPNGGIRVIKEQRDTRNGDFDSVVVTTLGQCDDPIRTKAHDIVPKNTAACVSPADLFSPAARKTYQEVLPRFLQRNRVLPGELVYRTDLLEKLEAGGSDITQAIQRVAIGRADGGDELHAIARQLHELVGQGIDKAFKDKKSGLHIPYNGSLADIVAKAKKTSSPTHAFSAALADRLMRATTWENKLAALLEVWQEVETLPTLDQEFCNGILSDYFSEWIEAPGTLASIIGQTDTGAELVDRMIAVMEPRPLPAGRLDPLRDYPAAQTLASAINLGVLPSARNKIITRVFEEISSNKRLYPDCVKTEFDLLKSFGDRIVHVLQGRRYGEMYEAFCQRSKRLMATETIESFIGGADIIDRPVMLIELNPNLVGEDSRNKLAALIRGVISHPQYEIAVLGTKKPLITLSTMRRLQVKLLESDLPKQDRMHGAQDIDQLAVRLLGQSELIRTMSRKAGTPVKAALALLRVANEALPRGQSIRMVMTAATTLLKSEEARDTLLGHPDLRATLRDLSIKAQAAIEFRDTAA